MTGQNRTLKLTLFLFAALSFFAQPGATAQDNGVEIIRDGTSITGTTPAVFNDDLILKCFHAVFVDRAQNELIFILKLSGRACDDAVRLAGSSKGSTAGVLFFESGNSFPAKVVVLDETPDWMGENGLVEMRLAYSPFSLLSDRGEEADYVKEATANMIYSNLVSIKIGDGTIPFASEGFRTAEQFTAIWKELQSVGALSAPQTTSSSLQRHEWVDLGLSVKWATCNLGASSPGDYGEYFSWGELSPKTDYSWQMYRFWSGGSGEDDLRFSKYNASPAHGAVDNKTRLEDSDDTARSMWDGQWRIPTRSEWVELFNGCTWTWTSRDGNSGYLLTSKKNGKSIFLPAAGSYFMSSLSQVDSVGQYWSSDLDGLGRSYYGEGIGFDSDNKYLYAAFRAQGLSIRPVTN